MNSENFNIGGTDTGKYLSGEQANLRKLRILVAPLDWGLGHATRCIPIVYETLRQGCDVWLAGEGAQEVLLRDEFPDIPFLQLTGYRVKYGRSAPATIWNLFRQSGKIIKAIKYENEWLKKMVTEHGFDAVISDNRFGLYHREIPCVFITHQLSIKSSLGSWSERILQKRNYSYINRFAECWVPDAAGENNLAGALSHPVKQPSVPVRYTGPLSRLINTGEKEVKDHLLIVISGPEPQRTIFENKIIGDIAHYPGSATIVRGTPGAKNLIPSTNSIKFYNHLPASALNEEMNRAEYIISRSGYSTVMDIMKLNKKSILVPTPGQAEQKYLGDYLQGKKVAVKIDQNSFSLPAALQAVRAFSFTRMNMKNENTFHDVISSFILSLKKH